MMKYVIAFLMILTIPCAHAGIKPMTDDEIRTIIVNGNLKTFEGECPCPFSTDKKGRPCGDNSEYFSTRGKILCYTEDVTGADVNTYRQRFNIPFAK